MNTTSNLLQTQLLGLQGNMMSFAMRLTANKEDARDLLQDTALRVLSNQDKFIDNSNFKGWVFTVMKNTFINHYHKLTRAQSMIEKSVDLYNVDTINPFGSDSTEDICSFNEINKAIEGLNEELRTPFVMSVSGYKYNEIAEKLNIPLGTVKSRIFFARKKLQSELKDF